MTLPWALRRFDAFDSGVGSGCGCLACVASWARKFPLFPGRREFDWLCLARRAKPLENQLVIGANGQFQRAILPYAISTFNLATMADFEIVEKTTTRNFVAWNLRYFALKSFWLALRPLVSPRRRDTQPQRINKAKTKSKSRANGDHLRSLAYFFPLFTVQPALPKHPCSVCSGPGSPSGTAILPRLPLLLMKAYDAEMYGKL